MLISSEQRQNIAIIGSGISGLGIAYLLHPYHNITVYEKNAYIGGHSRTVDLKTAQEPIAVDTGFIVFNKLNYPFLTSLFKHLNVPIQKSHMSFGVSINRGWLEYGTSKFNAMFAQKANLINPKFLAMLIDLFKFNIKARKYLTANPALTLGQFLDLLKLGTWFQKYYLLAMGGAIWSTPITKMLEFPARTFIRFFENHGLLTIMDQPQWYTVKNGSREYIKLLTEKFYNKIMLNCAIKKVVRTATKVKLYANNQHVENYDAVIFACHADQALSLLDKPSNSQQTILSKFRYHSNRIVLHSDPSFMPKRKKAWASWVYLSDTQEDQNSHVSLSYWMNNLQSIETDLPIIATLNPTRMPQETLIHDEYWFEHPIFDEAAITAQAQITNIQGQDRLWFCGAYQRYGFHEDGLVSAVKLAETMKIKPSWI